MYKETFEIYFKRNKIKYLFYADYCRYTISVYLIEMRI